jgi:hypothetical protein
MLVKGSAVMAGRSGNSNAGRDTSRIWSDGGSVAWAGWLSSTCVCKAPMKRRPLRGMVRISCCFRPLSPTAVRAALIRLVSVDSDTIRPPQTEAIRSSLLTTRSRSCTR